MYDMVWPRWPWPKCTGMDGMDPDPELEAALRKAIALIVSAQSAAGGCAARPHGKDQDLSVLVMQIVALRAAQNAEIPVPAETMAKATKYVKSCAAPGGGFGYQGPGNGPVTTVAGVLCLQLLGEYKDPSVTKGLQHLGTFPIAWDKPGVQYLLFTSITTPFSALPGRRQGVERMA